MVHKTTECLLYNLGAAERSLFSTGKGLRAEMIIQTVGIWGGTQRHCAAPSHLIFLPALLLSKQAHIVNLHFCQSYFFFFPSFCHCSFPALCSVCCHQLIWATLMQTPRLLQAFGCAWKVSSSSVAITAIPTAAGKFSPQTPLILPRLLPSASADSKYPNPASGSKAINPQFIVLFSKKWRLILFLNVGCEVWTLRQILRSGLQSKQ